MNTIDATVGKSGSGTKELTYSITDLESGVYYFRLQDSNSGVKSNLLTVTVENDNDEEDGVETMELVYVGKSNGDLIFEAKNYLDGVSQKPLSASHYLLVSNINSNSNVVPTIGNTFNNLNYSVEFARDTVRFIVTDVTKTGTFKFGAARYDGAVFSSDYVASNMVSVTLN